MRNNVRGPTSALSSFLREKGIRIDARRNVDQQPNDQDANENELGGENDENVQEDHSTAEPIDNVPEQMIASSSNSNETSKKITKKKKRKMSFDDNDLPVPIKKKTNLNFCRRCCRRFLHDNHVECVACLGIKKTGSSSKKGKKVVNQDGERVLFLSLRDLCLKTVAEYIDYVEEFGDISENSKQLISKIISRQRQINNNSIKLFLGPAEKTLMLYDCTCKIHNANALK
jgi:DNA repair protein RAD7